MNRTFFLFCFLTFFLNTYCDVNQLVKHCNEDWCNQLDPLDPEYSTKEYHKLLIQFFSAGIPQLIYEDGSKSTANANITSPCRQALEKVTKSLLKGEEWAFKCKYEHNCIIDD